jgi:hypothetical protein
LPFHLNVVPAPAFPTALSRSLSEKEVIAKSYPIQPVIQFSIGKTKSRYTETSKISGSFSLASK